MQGDKKVLICPMDWGIGHATRCVPVIEKLRELGVEVIVAGRGRPVEFLKKEYPGIQVIDFPGVRIKYPRNNWLALKMLQLAPLLLLGIWREHRALKSIARQINPSWIISDNRYGCWHASIPSVFITHQVEIKVPSGLKYFKRPINYFNRLFINKYNECWIPDYELHRGLAGELSHPVRMPKKAFYIGILSRFSEPSGFRPATGKQSYDLMVMLSGPEPQRTILEEKVLMQLVNINMQVAIVRGIPESDEAFTLDNRIHVFAHLETASMREMLGASDLIICRSGYSSIMDIVTLGKRAIFIPTPGQTEQEYLAGYLMEKKIYFSIRQSDFDLLYAIEMSKNYPGMVIKNDYKALVGRINKTVLSSLPFS